MKPVTSEPDNSLDLFRNRLDSIINMRHELVILAKKINWQFLEDKFSEFYCQDGRPGISIRMMAGLLILKATYKLSDEVVCQRWIENPYYQYFCGETFFCHEFPIERSSLTHFRKRIGDEALQALMQESLCVAYQNQALDLKQLDKVIVDTTVQPKAIMYPTDSRLLYKAICHIVKKAKKEKVTLRQSYLKVAKKALIMSGRYRHAKQMKRAKKTEKKLRTWLGRIIRDITRKTDKLEVFKPHFRKAIHILKQTKYDSDKILSWHAPEVECIGKGKADKPYEFGCKVSVATTLTSKAGHFVLHCQALHGRPYDGHTLKTALASIQQITGKLPQRVYVDKGYTGHKITEVSVYKSGQKRISDSIKKELRKRSIIEPVIGHLKNDGHLGRNYLKGRSGDKINAILSAAGHNFRLLLRYFRRLFFAWYKNVARFIRLIIQLFETISWLNNAKLTWGI